MGNLFLLLLQKLRKISSPFSKQGFALADEVVKSEFLARCFHLFDKFGAKERLQMHNHSCLALYKTGRQVHLYLFGAGKLLHNSFAGFS